MRIRLCTEEMLAFMAEHAGDGKTLADVRIVAGKAEGDGQEGGTRITVLIRDDCPPYDPVNGNDSELSRSIISAFCPKIDHRYSFGQNMTFMEWEINRADAL